MRAGPLSNKSVIERLNSDFINTWILIVQFRNPKDFYQNQVSQDWAATVAREFSYPVDSIVLDSNGELVAQNEFAKAMSTKDYLELLKNASK